MTKKSKIPASLRQQVWRHYQGPRYYGECFCCQDRLAINNFHCGHVDAEAAGGATSLANLRPVCAQCNQSCGSQHLLDFMRQYGYRPSVHWSGYREPWSVKCLQCLGCVTADLDT